MIEHFDSALTHFEADMREGKPDVQIASNYGKGTGGGGSIN
jgi:hypothetical protein